MSKNGGTERIPGTLPLEGVRVLDLTIVWAGPYCTSFLADMGAEVIRIESTRTFPPAPTRGARARPSQEDLDRSPYYLGWPTRSECPEIGPWNRTPLFNAHGRNKLSMTVDLLRPEGQQVLDRLVEVSDVFVENNPTRTMERLSISYDRFQAINPRIIMMRMPAYGNSGPYRDYRGFGLHMDSVVGHTVLRGYADMDASTVTPVLVCDAAGGTHAAFAILAALNHRERTGEGQLIELPQAEAFIPMLGSHFMDYSMNGRNGETRGNRHPYAIQGCYPCKGDDRWVVVTLYDEQDWRRLCAAMGDPAWTCDPAVRRPRVAAAQPGPARRPHRRVDVRARPHGGHADAAGRRRSRWRGAGPGRRLLRPPASRARLLPGGSPGGHRHAPVPRRAL